MNNLIGVILKCFKMTVHPSVIGNTIPEVILKKFLKTNVRLYAHTQHLKVRW